MALKSELGEPGSQFEESFVVSKGNLEGQLSARKLAFVAGR